jgi:ABC-type Co2+ transport system permease subunit
VRIPEGIVSPALIIIGWVVSLVMLYLIYYKSNYKVKDLTSIASMGAFIFVLQLIPIPLQLLFIIPFPIHLTLSGIMIGILIIGPRRGMIAGSSAVILNHIFVLTSIGTMGLNLANMFITSLLIGSVFHQLYKRVMRELKILVALAAGVSFVMIEGILVLIELVFFHNTDLTSDIIGLIFFAYIGVLALIEGIFSAVIASYYSFSRDVQITDVYDASDNQDGDEIEFLYTEVDYEYGKAENGEYNNGKKENENA